MRFNPPTDGIKAYRQCLNSLPASWSGPPPRATYSFAGTSAEAVREKAIRHFEAFFGDRPFALTDFGADAVMTVGGDLLHWNVHVEATALTHEEIATRASRAATASR